MPRPSDHQLELLDQRISLIKLRLNELGLHRFYLDQLNRCTRRSEWTQMKLEKELDELLEARDVMPFTVQIEYEGQSFALNMSSFQAAVDLVSQVSAAGGQASVSSSHEATRAEIMEQADLQKLRDLIAARPAHASNRSSEPDQG